MWSVILDDRHLMKVHDANLCNTRKSNPVVPFGSFIGNYCSTYLLLDSYPLLSSVLVPVRWLLPVFSIYPELERLRFLKDEKIRRRIEDENKDKRRLVEKRIVGLKKQVEGKGDGPHFIDGYWKVDFWETSVSQGHEEFYVTVSKNDRARREESDIVLS